MRVLINPRTPKLSYQCSVSFLASTTRYRRSSWQSGLFHRWEHTFHPPKFQFMVTKPSKTLSVSKLFFLVGFGLFLGSQNNAFAEDEKEEQDSEEEISDTQQSVLKEAQEEATRILKIFKEQIGAPGIVAAVLHQGKYVYLHAEGYSDVENLVHMQTQTPLRIASISKSVTAVALMKLVEQGKVDLDAPIQKYIPDFPEKSEGTITVRHLASHLSGIRHYDSTLEEFQSKVNYKTVADAIKVFEKDDLKFAPGSSYLYSTYGYTLLSLVMERASGTPFLEFVQKEVFQPLKMNHTFPDIPSKIVPGRAHYYYRKKKGEAYKLVNAPWVDNSNKWAGGGFMSTVQDIAKLGYSLIHHQILHSESVQQIMTPHPNAISKKHHKYGLGLQLYNIKKFPEHSKSIGIFGHSGGACGGTTEFIILPEDDMVVVMMSNLGSSPSLRSKCVKLAEVFLTHLEEKQCMTKK